MKRSIIAALAVLVPAAGFWALSTPPEELARSTASEQLGPTGVAIRLLAGPVSTRVIPDGDLPPSGTRSLFDHHVAQLGALPFPFADLLDSFRGRDRWNQGGVTLLVPDGRSLRRDLASFQQPRVLFAAQVDAPPSPHELAPQYSGRLFLGFVEAADEIEIISYNEAAGRFEFQLVENYCAGCVPRIVYARRAVCTTCHHAGVPIFSRRPWGETNGQMQIARRIAEAHGVEWLDADSTLYHGAPLSTQMLMPETFDELTVLGTEIATAQRVWLDGCGEEGLACRRQLLGQALSLLVDPGAFHPQSADSDRTRALQARHWPAGGIPLPANLLSSRDPLAGRAWWHGPLQSLRSFLDQWKARWFTSPTTDDESNLRLARFNRTASFPPELDPREPRAPRELLTADSLFAVHALSRLFRPQDRERLKVWSAGDVKRVQAAVQRGDLDALLGPEPIRRVGVLQQMARALDHIPPDYCCLDDSGLSPPQLENTPPLKISEGSVLEVFREYCFACHRGNLNQRLNFMGGDSASEVLKTLRGKSEIRDALDYERFAGTERAGKLMPPRGSAQRARLEEARRQGSRDVERMRGAVTPLFQFE